MKYRVSALDIKILVSEIEKSIKGYRLQNIYNLVSNNRSFLLKFAIPDSKINLVIESGFKAYLTDFQRPTQQQPSGFAIKLRKHLKTKRLTNVKQVDNDRVVVFEFSDGFYYLVLEFFSAGNIILLDENKKIMGLYRLVEHNDKNPFNYGIGEEYQMFDTSLFNKDDEGLDSQEKVNIFTKEQVSTWVKNEKDNSQGKVLSINKMCFLKFAYLSSDLIQIKLKENGVNPSDSCLTLDGNDELLDTVTLSLNQCEQKLNQLIHTPIGKIDGYILSRKNPLFKEDEEGPDNLEYVYDEFHPYEPSHKASDSTKIEIVKGYNKTLDHFFTTIESTKTSLSRQQQQSGAEKRLQSVKNEHSSKIEKLSNIQESNVKKAELIMLYNEVIEDCKASVQKLIDQQMDWLTMEKLIKMEQQRGNEIAKMIKLPLNLIKNEITLRLPDNEEETDTEETDSESDRDSESDSENENRFNKKRSTSKQDKTVDVTIDITLSAFANSTRFFDAKKVAQDKQQKTEKNAHMAIKSTQRKIAQDMKKLEKQSKQVNELKHLRNKFWFEKYYWFLSSDGYLCIAGRDNNQIDTIYYRYFDNENDILASSDQEDSLKVIIKNPYKNKDIPPPTLIQAGIFSMTSSKAWENKMVVSPWYVKGKDVSKKDYDGTILPSGLLNVTKEKTYLPPCQLNMGFALLWIGSEETTEKYKNAKKARDEEHEFKLVKGDEGSATKISELKAMLDKLGNLETLETLEEDSKFKSEPTLIEEKDKKGKQGQEEVIRAPGPNDQIQVNIRGKKNKLKKIKQKYGSQDEEERRLRMSVLGTLKQVENQKQSEKEGDDSDNRKKAAQTSSERRLRKKYQEANQLKKLLYELEESNDNDEDNQETVKEPFYSQIAGLISSPNKTDDIIDCIPVFAPWYTLQKYNYKIKIQAGNLKKGKAVSDVIEFFKRQSKTLEKEGSEWFDNKNIVELISNQDALMSLTAGKLKVTYPGGDNGSSNKGKSSKGAKNKNKKT